MGNFGFLSKPGHPLPQTSRVESGRPPPQPSRGQAGLRTLGAALRSAPLRSAHVTRRAPIAAWRATSRPSPRARRPLPLSRKRSSRAADAAGGRMVLDSVARIVKVQLPAYLKQLPVPDSITGFARLTGNPPAAVPSSRAAPVGAAVESAARRGAGRGGASGLGT